MDELLLKYDQYVSPLRDPVQLPLDALVIARLRLLVDGIEEATKALVTEKFQTVVQPDYCTEITLKKSLLLLQGWLHASAIEGVHTEACPLTWPDTSLRGFSFHSLEDISMAYLL